MCTLTHNSSLLQKYTEALNNGRTFEDIQKINVKVLKGLGILVMRNWSNSDLKKLWNYDEIPIY